MYIAPRMNKAEAPRPRIVVAMSGSVDSHEVHRAADTARDQSYFLFATTREQLGMLRFPLGDMPKAKVREIARELDLPTADKQASPDICFVPQGHYGDVVRRMRPE